MGIFGKRLVRPAQWFRSGLEQARRVGRINGADGRPASSGFLFDGELLGERYAKLPVLITCDFCIAKLPTPITVLFEGMFDDASRNVTAQPALTLAQSADLHYAVLLLQRWPGHVPDLIPCRKTPEAGDRVAVISYPLGGGLAFSIEENPVVEPNEVEAFGPLSKDDYLFYRATTEP